MSHMDHSRRPRRRPSTSPLALPTDINPRRVRVPGSAIQMVYRSGRQTAQKQLLDHYQAAGRTRIPIQLLVRCTSTGPSVRGILKSWNSACGTPNALHDHRSLVGDPFLRG
jgi:hypothetical protein